VAALLTLLINKHGQKVIVILTSEELVQVILEDVKKQKRENWERKNCSQVKKHSSIYYTVAMKSSGDIFAERVREQKIEEHVTDLDLRNDENRSSYQQCSSTRTSRWI